MRLLNTSTLRVESVAPDNVPPYAILSHRWTDEEVSFQEINTEAAKLKGGFAKVQYCCAIACRDGFSYAWIDTCCIDKTSSAELSEAINSMFAWYRNARVCYAYLHDATGIDDMPQSEWFDRGWTLQELIAPRHVRFYAGDWTMFGERTSLCAIISEKTGISRGFLHGQDLSHASVAERMSWAATRRTTREEDMAYCLLGIFNIQMPLIYGEGGEKAFFRLQRKLIKQSNDHSWLAWSIVPRNDDSTDSLGGVMAKSPAYFQGCRDVVICHRGSTDKPITVTNVGIHVDLPLHMTKSGPCLLLDCRWRYDYTNVISVPLKQPRQYGRYYRASMNTSVCPESNWSTHPSNVTLSLDRYREPPNILADLYFFKSIPPGFEIIEVHPPQEWEPSPAHVRARREGSDGALPQRLVRLRYLPEDDDIKSAKDYVLELNNRTKTDGLGVDYQFRLGILPRQSFLSQAHKDIHSWGKALVVPRLRGLLAVRIETKSIYETPTHVVEIFVDRVEGLGPSQKWVSQVLPASPSELRRMQQVNERDRAYSRQAREYERRGYSRKAEEERETRQRLRLKTVETRKKARRRLLAGCCGVLVGCPLAAYLIDLCVWMVHHLENYPVGGELRWNILVYFTFGVSFFTVCSLRWVVKGGGRFLRSRLRRWLLAESPDEDPLLMAESGIARGYGTLA